MVVVEGAERNELARSVPYISKWIEVTKLNILQPTTATNQYKSKKERGLFYIFMQNSFFECVREWTNSNMVKKITSVEKDEIKIEELYAYVGLEIATSLLKLNYLKKYWSSKLFYGHDDFKRFLSRERFLKIRALFQLYTRYIQEEAVLDPIWHSRTMSAHFFKKCVKVAVPVGVSALDENTIRCKARTSARSYMKSKPVTF